FIVTRAFYAGALPLMLAVLTMFRPTKEKIAIAATGAVALLVVLGVPPFFQIVQHIPGFAQAHNTRLAIVTLLSIALLAGYRLCEVPRAKWVVLAIVIVPILAGLARAGAYPVASALKSAWGFVDPTQKDVLPLMSIFIWIPFAVAAAALIWWRPRYF